jgi:hypothetical protein
VEAAAEVEAAEAAEAAAVAVTDRVVYCPSHLATYTMTSLSRSTAARLKCVDYSVFHMVDSVVCWHRRLNYSSTLFGKACLYLCDSGKYIALKGYIFQVW